MQGFQENYQENGLFVLDYLVHDSDIFLVCLACYGAEFAGVFED